MSPPWNVAELLDRMRWPVYFLDAGAVDLTAFPLAPGRVIPVRSRADIVAVRPGVEPPPWAAVRELLEEPEP